RRAGETPKAAVLRESAFLADRAASPLAGEESDDHRAHEKGRLLRAANRISSTSAQERTRTSTGLLPLAPEASASASSATWAGHVVIDTKIAAPVQIETGRDF